MKSFSFNDSKYSFWPRKSSCKNVLPRGRKSLPEGRKLDDTVQDGWKKGLFQLLIDNPNYTFSVREEDCKKPKYNDGVLSDDGCCDDYVPDGWKLTESLGDHVDANNEKVVEKYVVKLVINDEAI